MSNDIYLQKLSDNQLEAIKNKNNVLLTAIPGSGKTRTLTNKILYEYEELEYKKIVAITYTNRAAEEMNERIINQLGIIPNNIWIGTIHKFCLEFILRKYSSRSKYLSKPFSILGEDDDDKLKEELKEKYEVYRFDNIDYSLSIDGTPNEKKYYDYVNEYYAIQRTKRSINFNLILYEAYQLLHDNPDICLNLSVIIKYLCVDEYQDTQELQYQILSLIYKATKKFNIFVVGDPNQAIYAGLGGVVKNKTELETCFETKFDELVLDECYRSSQEIIDFYKQFALKEIEMKAFDNNYYGSEIIIEENIQKEELVEKICEIVKQNIERGIPEKEICIIAPQWHFLYDISSKIKQKLPDLKFDAPNIIPLKKDEENICYKLSKLLLTNYSFYNKNRIIHIVKDIKKQLIDEFGINIELSYFEFIKIILSSRTEDVIGTEYLKNSLINIFKNIGLYEEFSYIIDEYIEMTSHKIELYKKWGIEDDRLSFEKSLRSKDGIVVSTIHGIKGDEFRVVIAFGLLRGYVPHWNSIYANTEQEDSKKLLFVLCSRAKEKLYLFAERGRKTQKGDELETNKELKQALINIKYNDLL